MSGLGNIGDFMHDQNGLADLSWLEVESGKNYDNIPSGNLAEAIPQLEAAWEHGEGRNTSFIPNQVMDTNIGVKPVSPELIQEVASVAKKAMMIGHSNAEIITSLKDRFPLDTIKSASEELKKVASEQGLLGNVYIDLSCFDTCKQASQVLGKHRTRLASFAVGAPRKEANFTDSFGNCRVLGKKVVASVDYDAGLLSKYETMLKSAGTLSSGLKIASKEDLRNAFVNPLKKEASNSHHGAQDQIVLNASEEELASATASIKKEAAEKEAAEVLSKRIAAARPIMATVQTAMLKGLMGESLKAVIAKEVPSDSIQRFASEIKNAVDMQGLLGTLYTDVSHYGSVNGAVSAIKSASTSPRFIIASSDTGDNRLNKVASATGCVELSREVGVEAKVASSIVDSLAFNEKLSSDTAFALSEKLAAGENPIAVIREAYLSTMETKKEARTGGVQATYNAPLAKQASTVSIDKVKTAANKALESGISVMDVESKVASMLPASEAFGAVRSVVSSMKEIQASSLDNCSTERYPLHPEARIAASSKCASCIHKASGVCAKQGVKFAGEGFIDALSNISESGSRTASAAEQYGLSSGLDVDFSGVIELPTTNIEGSHLDAASGMDDFLK